MKQESKVQQPLPSDNNDDCDDDEGNCGSSEQSIILFYFILWYYYYIGYILLFYFVEGRCVGSSEQSIMYQQALPLLHSQVHRAGENTEKKNNSRVKRLGKIKHTDTFMSPNPKIGSRGNWNFHIKELCFGTLRVLNFLIRQHWGVVYNMCQLVQRKVWM